MSNDPLVSTAWLAARLADPRLVVLDATVLLAAPRFDGDYVVASGCERWAAAHIPKSRHADLLHELADPLAPYSFALPAPKPLAAALARLGVGDNSLIVTYDSDGGIWAARLWWMLHSFGLDARVLDGGWQAWQAQGHATASGAAPPPIRAGRITRAFQHERWVDRARVQDIVADNAPGTLICALSLAAFAGTAPTRYTRRGHIPSSRHLPARGLLADDGRYQPKPVLAGAVATALESASPPWVLYCGGGISAAADALVMTRLGYSGIALYDGSLQEWSARPDLPLVTVPPDRQQPATLRAVAAG